MRKLEVRLDWGDEQVVVGRLAEQERRVYFEYDGTFVHPGVRAVQGLALESWLPE